MVLGGGGVMGSHDGRDERDEERGMSTATCVMAGPIALPATDRLGSARARVRAEHPAAVQLIRFGLVGAVGTLINAVIFLVLRQWWGALPADLVALVLSTLIGTEINRHFTFGATRSTHPWRAHVQNGATVVFYACCSSAVLLLLSAMVTDPSALLETSAVSVASVFGGLVRFAAMRYWVFSADRCDA